MKIAEPGCTGVVTVTEVRSPLALPFGQSRKRCLFGAIALGVIAAIAFLAPSAIASLSRLF